MARDDRDTAGSERETIPRSWHHLFIVCAMPVLSKVRCGENTGPDNAIVTVSERQSVIVAGAASCSGQCTSASSLAANSFHAAKQQRGDARGVALAQLGFSLLYVQSVTLPQSGRCRAVRMATYEVR